MEPVTRITGSFADYCALVMQSRKKKLCCRRKFLHYGGFFSVVQMFCERDDTEMWLFGRSLCHQFADHACTYACASLFFVKN